MADTFTFGLDLQTKLLALMIKDKDYLARNCDYIKPFYFESEILVDLSRIVIAYYKKYKNTIGFTALLTELDTLFSTTSRPNEEDYYAIVKQLYPHLINERQYIIDKTVDFIRYQEYKRTISEGIELLQKNQLDDVHLLFDKVTKLQLNNARGMMYFTPEEIQARFVEDDNQKVPTGILGFDEALGGGLGRGELGIIMAPPNVGKSILLTIIGGGGLKLRKRVAHFSHEMRQKKVGMRYDRHLLGKGMLAIRDSRDESENFLIQFARNLKCNLYIKDWPTRTATVNNIRAEVEFLQSEGLMPDVVIVDYPAIMKPSRKRDGRHQEIEEINEELRGLAGEFNVSLWGAAQTTREAVNKAVIDISDLGESFAQSKVADVVAAACQTNKEYEAQTIRLFLAKNRDEQKHQMLRYRIDYATVRLTFQQ